MHACLFNDVRQSHGIQVCLLANAHAERVHNVTNATDRTNLMVSEAQSCASDGSSHNLYFQKPQTTKTFPSHHQSRELHLSDMHCPTDCLVSNLNSVYIHDIGPSIELDLRLIIIAFAICQLDSMHSCSN